MVSCVEFPILFSPLISSQLQGWNGTFWSRALLSDLGLVLNLQHGVQPCPVPLGSVRNMHILDVNGIFKAKVRFCGCSRSSGTSASDAYVQLIRACLFPATAKIPQTAFTFRALTLASQLNNQGKLTGYDFYHSLMHITDNAEIDPPKVCPSHAFKIAIGLSFKLRNDTMSL